MAPESYGSPYHAPVMVAEVLRFLDPARGGVYLDGTLGGGGHTEALLANSADAVVVGVDRDPNALAEATARLQGYGDRFGVVEGNFYEVARDPKLAPGGFAGMLMDLGISSHQIDETGRGFTFRSGAPLDMRMDGPTSGRPTAADLLNSSEEGDLANIFYRWGDEKKSWGLAGAILERRAEKPLQSSDDLVGIINQVLHRPGPQDFARIFQAVRIAVNDEMESLAAALPAFRDALRSGGVMVVISYHSLEDRQVKDSFREWSRECVCPPGLPICICRGTALGETLTRKPLAAGAEEVAANPRARSARLRAWRKA